MTADADVLCMDCGLCCDETFYGSVVVAAGEAQSLGRVGLHVIQREAALAMPQPCAALRGCLCSVYGDRPSACAAYECALRKSVGAGACSLEEARAKVETMRRLLATIREAFDCPPPCSIWQKILTLEEPTSPEDAAIAARHYASAISAVAALLELGRASFEPRFAGGGTR